MYTDTEIIKVNLMGRFQISCGDKILDEDKICSAKGIRLCVQLRVYSPVGGNPIK